MEKGRKLTSASLLCGLVTLFACIPFIGGYQTGNAAWGLTAGILTVISSLVILQKYDDINIQMMKLYGGIMFVIWATVAGVLTFDGPFVTTGELSCYYFSQSVCRYFTHLLHNHRKRILCDLGRIPCCDFLCQSSIFSRR